MHGPAFGFKYNCAEADVFFVLADLHRLFGDSL